MSIDWSKHHRFMPHPGLCGPTTIWMVLDACGIKKNINKIARSVWLKWYGAPAQLIIGYLAKYFGEVGYETRCRISDIEWHLGLGRIVIVNWWDEDDGHFSIVGDIIENQLVMIDSSRDRPMGWSILAEDFIPIWYDYLADDNRLRVNGLLIWVDPKSVKGA